MSPDRDTYIPTETDIWSYSFCELVQIIGGSFKNTRKSKQACNAHLHLFTVFTAGLAALSFCL